LDTNGGAATLPDVLYLFMHPVYEGEGKSMKSKAFSGFVAPCYPTVAGHIR
jgi:hypothetical protein